ncbi:MAG: TonB-dependent receptor [Candidatus Marinimicrobia bacterium]|nr:TonB-dependent receptor [Candidatus Neomarinimicrobiota bacterium]MCK4448775.1 TonB-dependent receptor [Candidatus Neomarinimicrobiota bacterium]
MKKILYILLITIVLTSYLMAEPPISTGTIMGKVIDSSTKKPLIGVNVLIEHTTVGASTNIDGKYCIQQAPIGNFHLVATMIGYEVEQKGMVINANEVLTVDFDLKPTILEIGAVVVTGTSTPHIYKDMPVKTEVITRLAIERKHAFNLAEALSFNTGIRVENNCQNCNFSQVRILGMEGKYSQILVDGDPVVSSLAGVYGLEHFPEEMLDRIEIVKGGGSSLYGGGAIAGVINIITRQPMINQVKLKYFGNSIGGKSDQHIGATAEVVNKDGTLGAYVFGSLRERNPYDYNNDGYSELGELKNESLGFNSYYKPIDLGELIVHFHRIHEERRGGNKFDLPVHEAEIAEWLEHWRYGGTIRWQHRLGPLFDYRIFYSFALQDRKSYYGGLGGYTASDTLESLSFYGKTENPLHISGLQMNYRFGCQLFTAGVQYFQDKLKDKATANPAYHLDETYKNIGVFFQDNLHLGTEKQLELVIGTRIDKHSEINNWIFSPRINIKYNFDKGFTLRAAYTTGFEAPQTYDEDLHLCGIEGDQRVTRNDKGLKEERSNSFSGGIDYIGYISNLPVMFAINGFKIDITDVFTNKFVQKIGNTEVWSRVNGKGANVTGVEFDAGIRPISRIEIRGGMTYKNSEYNEVLEDWGTKNFLRTPDLYGNLRLLLDLTSNISFFAMGNYTGKADVPHEIIVTGQDDPNLVLEKSDDFAELDLGLSYSIQMPKGLKCKFSFGIKNVTDSFQSDLDKGPNRDPAYVYGPRQPRTIYAGFETSF